MKATLKRNIDMNELANCAKMLAIIAIAKLIDLITLSKQLAHLRETKHPIKLWLETKRAGVRAIVLASWVLPVIDVIDHSSGDRLRVLLKSVVP